MIHHAIESEFLNVIIDEFQIGISNRKIHKLMGGSVNAEYGDVISM